MLTINTNLSSLIAQSSMKSSTNKLNQAIERMTTGFKINHSKDNAANYPIATNMTTKIGAYNVAEDNAAMGLDLISTAEGTLSQIEDKLQRLRALAEQASNGTYGEQSLNAINAEANALVDEINRLYSTAEYNGLKLFGGSTELEADEAAPISTFALARAVSESDTFIQEVVKRDTSGMTKLEDVAASSTLAQGTYSISTAEGLAKLATMQNQGLITSGSEFVLASDIDLSAYSTGEGWIPIGKGNSTFESNFDGNGYVVSNLTINTATTDYLDSHTVGLFGGVNNVTIKNLGIENAKVKGVSDNSLVGVLLGSGDGINIVNCYATGNIYAAYMAGGLIGSLGSDDGDVNISYCWTDVDVESESRAAGFICTGPEVYPNTIVSNCYSLGDVYCDNVSAGFVAGISSGSLNISNCYSSGTVTSLNSAPAGFSAITLGSLTNCYWDMESSGVVNDSGGATGVTTAELNELINNGVLPAIDGSGGGGGTGGTDPDPGIPDGGGSGSGGGAGGAGGTTPNNPSFTPPSYAPDMIVLQIGAASNWASQVGVSTKFSLLGVDDLRMIGLDLTTDYLTQIDDMLGLVSEKQTHFGATSNRLESVLEEITIQRDNLVSSRSTIRDADIAEVSSHYIQQQILQQASATLLATANQSPSIALQLI